MTICVQLVGTIVGTSAQVRCDKTIHCLRCAKCWGHCDCHTR